MGNIKNGIGSDRVKDSIFNNSKKMLFEKIKNGKMKPTSELIRIYTITKLLITMTNHLDNAQKAVNKGDFETAQQHVEKFEETFKVFKSLLKKQIDSANALKSKFSSDAED